jgi:hypothetical protein
VLSASNNSFEEKYYDACVTAATDLLEDFYMSRGEIRSKCECVKNRWIGDISFNSISWEGAGKNSATLFLIECSKNNIVNTFSNAVLNSEKIAYKRKNSKINTDEIKRIDGFGLCVGMRSYEEMHRVARDESAAFLGLNKSWFQAMYQNCEVKFNLR